MDLKKILVCATKGSEELELVTIVNLLKRANFSVKLAKVECEESLDEISGNPLLINCNRGIRIVNPK
jgi:putative intracellular protease/amidase